MQNEVGLGVFWLGLEGSTEGAVGGSRARTSGGGVTHLLALQ